MMIMGFIRLLRNRRNKVSTVMVTNIRIKRLLNLDKNEAISENTRKKDVRITTVTSFLMTPPHHPLRNTVVRNVTTIVTRSIRNHHKDTKASLTSRNSKGTMYYKYLRITTSKTSNIKNSQVIRYF